LICLASSILSLNQGYISSQSCDGYTTTNPEFSAQRIGAAKNQHCEKINAAKNQRGEKSVLKRSALGKINAAKNQRHGRSEMRRRSDRQKLASATTQSSKAQARDI
jgi:hypothetical protein